MEWISVKDRLPECGFYTVAYYNPSDTSKKLYVIPAWRGRNRWYYDNAEQEEAENSTLCITHWMPFPEAPTQ